MKKILSILCIFIMILSIFPFTAKAENITHTVTGMNSYREADTLIVYNIEGTYTGSNEWGYEVRVDGNNRVIGVGGNNNLIPKGGFVVSGHGVSATFLRENVKIGDKIVFIEERMIISIGEDDPTPFYSFTMPFNGTNCHRSADYNVIFTPSFGKTTGTNAYGFEVTVEDGIVTVCGGNNSKIPRNGFVISAHGTSMTALSGIAVVGMEVSYNTKTKTITFTFGEKSLLLSDLAKLEVAEECLATAKRNCYVIDITAMENLAKEARELYETLRSEYEANNNIDHYMERRQELLAMIQSIKNGTSECRPVEYRAVWIEPTERNQSQVEETVRSAYDSGINTICLETFFDSTMIYPTPDGSLFKQNPSLKGFDLLKAYIDECHALGMELHVWMPVFNVGFKGGKYSNYSIFDKKPEWRITANDGTPYGDGVIQTLDPANKEACDYLLETYRYILENYNIDGFQLDYIRYPHNGEVDYGYDEKTLNAFKEKYGVIPEFDGNASYWNDWCIFRCDYVTDFVRRTRELIDEVAPNVLLSADLYGNMDVAPYAVYQNGKQWIEEGLLDIAFPMTYDNTEGLTNKAGKYLSINSNTVLTVCGLGIYIASENAETMRDQVKSLRTLHADGCCFFELSAYVKKGVHETLIQGPFSENALPPFRDIYKSVVKYSDYIYRRVNDIMVPASMLSESEQKDILTALKVIIDGELTEVSINSVNECISTIENMTAKSVLERDMRYVAKLLNHYDWSGPRIEESSELQEVSDTEESIAENNGETDISTRSQDTDDGLDAPDNSSKVITAAIASVIIVAAAIAVTIVTIRKKKAAK